MTDFWETRDLICKEGRPESRFLIDHQGTRSVMTRVHSISVVHSKQISSDIRSCNFVRKEKMAAFPAFYNYLSKLLC